MGNLKRAIAIDFDGTLCENNYPDIGEPNWNVIYEAIQEQKHGAGLILWTCREGKLLYDAMEACFDWGLQFDAINDSLPEWKEHFGTSPRKIGADEYWDDKAKQGLAPVNAVPIIDQDYRGEIIIPLHNYSNIPQMITHGDRIAQMAVVPFWQADFEEVSELDETERGAGGFGSTGKQ